MNRMRGTASDRRRRRGHGALQYMVAIVLAALLAVAAVRQLESALQAAIAPASSRVQPAAVEARGLHPE